MKSEGLAYFTDTYLTSIGLLIFFAFFVAVIIWTSRRESQKLYRRVENLPLEVDHE
ncbi:MAG: cbb3-type cytochrome c oxidase subunit 3 [Bdellovibrionota bacterium]